MKRSTIKNTLSEATPWWPSRLRHHLFRKTVFTSRGRWFGPFEFCCLLSLREFQQKWHNNKLTTYFDHINIILYYVSRIINSLASRSGQILKSSTRVSREPRSRAHNYYTYLLNVGQRDDTYVNVYKRMYHYFLNTLFEI